MAYEQISVLPFLLSQQQNRSDDDAEKNSKGEYILKEVIVKEFQIEKAVIEHKQQDTSPPEQYPATGWCLTDWSPKFFHGSPGRQ